MNQTITLLVPAIIAIANAGMALYFHGLNKKLKRLKANPLETEGQITNIKTYDKSTTLTYSFSDYRGRQISNKVGTNKGENYKIGKQVNITYEKSAPTNNSITELLSNRETISGLMVYIFGGTAVVMPIIFYFVFKNM